MKEINRDPHQLDHALARLRGNAPTLAQLSADNPTLGRAIKRHQWVDRAVKRIDNPYLVAQSMRPPYRFDLSKLRRESGMMQEEMIAESGIIPARVKAMERMRTVPTPEDVDRFYTALGLTRWDAAMHLIDDVADGYLHMPPHLLARLLLPEGETGERLSEALWAAQLHYWRAQMGVPILPEAAREMSQLSRAYLYKGALIPRASLKRYEANPPEPTTLIDLMAMAVTYSVSPLSLFNGQLLAYLNHNNPYGFGYDRDHDHASINEDAFAEAKAFLIALDLVPDWQQPLFSMLLLSELCITKDDSGFGVEYHPFPLTPRGLKSYLGDPTTCYMVEESAVPHAMRDTLVVTPYDEYRAGLTGLDARYELRLRPYEVQGHWYQELIGRYRDDDYTETVLGRRVRVVDWHTDDEATGSVDDEH